MTNRFFLTGKFEGKRFLRFFKKINFWWNLKFYVSILLRIFCWFQKYISQIGMFLALIYWNTDPMSTNNFFKSVYIELRILNVNTMEHHRLQIRVIGFEGVQCYFMLFNYGRVLNAFLEHVTVCATLLRLFRHVCDNLN